MSLATTYRISEARPWRWPSLSRARWLSPVALLLLWELGARLGALALNRYPGERGADLQRALAAYAQVPEGFGLMLGNGSDELISLLAMPYIEDGTLVPLPSLGVNATHLFLCRHNDEVLPQVGAFVEFALDRLEGSQAFAPTETRLAALERAATRRRPAPKSFRRLEVIPAQ